MNRVEVSLEFFFKGQHHALSAIIDLDQCLRHEEPMVAIYDALASENGISRHSYEYDVLVMEPIRFGQATGRVADYICDGALDLEAFYPVWLEEQSLKVLQPIAARHLGIEDLDEHPRLKAALLEAYRASAPSDPVRS